MCRQQGRGTGGRGRLIHRWEKGTAGDYNHIMSFPSPSYISTYVLCSVPMATTHYHRVAPDRQSIIYPSISLCHRLFPVTHEHVPPELLAQLPVLPVSKLPRQLNP